MKFRGFLLLIFVMTVLAGCSKDVPPPPMITKDTLYKITIESVPEKADIYVKEEKKGQAPVVLDMTLADVLDVSASKGKEYRSTGEQIIRFGQDNTATLTVLMMEVGTRGLPGSEPIAREEILECKTARTVARTYNAPLIDYNSAGIYFDFDKAVLKPESKEILDELALHVYAASRAGMIIAVEGFTDSIGDNRYNLSLSEKRAKAVVDYFVNHPKYSIPREDFYTQGYGEECPFMPNSTRQGRSQNRRTDITLIPKGAKDELPEEVLKNE